MIIVRTVIVSTPISFSLELVILSPVCDREMFNCLVHTRLCISCAYKCQWHLIVLQVLLFKLLWGISDNNVALGFSVHQKFARIFSFVSPYKFEMSVELNTCLIADQFSQVVLKDPKHARNFVVVRTKVYKYTDLKIPLWANTSDLIALCLDLRNKRLILFWEFVFTKISRI